MMPWPTLAALAIFAALCPLLPLLYGTRRRASHEREGNARSGVIGLIAAGLLVPALGAALYFSGGTATAVILHNALQQPQRDATALGARIADYLKKHPDQPGFRLALVGLLREQGRNADALATINVLRQSYAGEPLLLLTLAELYLEMNMPTEALVAAEQVLALRPGDPRALTMAGSAAMVQGQVDVALAYWERLVKVLPPDAELRGLLQRMMEKLRKP